MSPSATSTFFNTSRAGDSTTSLGNLFRCLPFFSVKKIFLISSPNLPCYSLRPFPLILLLFTWEKRLTPTLLQPPFKQLWRARSSVLSLLFSRLNTPAPSAACTPDPAQLHCPSLDMIPHLSVFLVMRCPDLSAGFDVQPRLDSVTQIYTSINKIFSESSTEVDSPTDLFS